MKVYPYQWTDGDMIEVVYEYDCGHYSNRTYIDKVQYMIDKKDMPFKGVCRTCVRRGVGGERLDAIINIVDILDSKQLIRDRQLKSLGI